MRKEQPEKLFKGLLQNWHFLNIKLVIKTQELLEAFTNFNLHKASLCNRNDMHCKNQYMTIEILNLTLSQAHLGIIEYLPYTGTVNYTSESRTREPEHFSPTLK